MLHFDIFSKHYAVSTEIAKTALLCNHPVPPHPILSLFAHFFFFFGLGLDGEVPSIASKVLLGSLLDSGLSEGEPAGIGGATPGGNGNASSPRFMTLSRRLSGLCDRSRLLAAEGSSRPGGGGNGEAFAFSSCMAAFKSVSLAAHCCAFFQQ